MWVLSSGSVINAVSGGRGLASGVAGQIEEASLGAARDALLESELLRVCREKSEINKELTSVKDDNKKLLDKLQVLSGLHLQPTALEEHPDDEVKYLSGE
ncbi:unnamed protein product [Vitrella brassicaformis CCMP3155]|uniref:Uncharacterized protein n=1 Tax=Vitrella brassicaformis (strain CCMP3155) TaxID=1169540 RepID=A0A0G4FLR7_VITBC|nr:unnamed protein product [Vitrella brassicaformis CCMP3155]|eukprot:CEM14962.1 unnamed protein product [Vitrella brassicaformis CCMP3155]